MSGFVIKSLYTRAWKTCTDPSSEDDANNGYVGWNCTERSARAWYLSQGDMHGVSMSAQKTDAEKETGKGRKEKGSRGA